MSWKAENPGLQLHVQVNPGVCHPNLGSIPDYRHEEIWQNPSRGARFVTRNYSRSTRGEQIVKDLKWEDLSTRRYHSRLILFYQIINKQVAIPFVENQFIVPSSRGRFHALTHKHIGYKHSYYPQTIRDWNCLPDKTRSSPSLEIFKSRLGELSR